jgi:hypothetical protein
MGRRGQECRCCGCHSCEKKPEILAVNLAYPTGGGVTFEADTKNDPPAWQAISTTCTVPAEKIGVAFFVTKQGDGYTSAPEVTLAGGGGTLSDYTVTLQSPIVGIKVTNGGSGYSVAPSVTISNPPGGGRIRAASAQAIVEGKVVSVTLNDPGEGYTGPPTVSLAGGQGAKVDAVMDGYLAAVAITNGGEGYTSAPTVTLSGGGGSGATAKVSFSSETGVVTGGFVTAEGSGYTSPPEVTISGGGGEGAIAEATILFKIASLSLTAGGSGYPPNPEVRIEGSPGGGATATAKISGSVVAVEVLNPGLYRYSKNKTSSTAFPNWPTVTIAGPATAEPVFSGKVVGVGVPFGSTNSGWTSEPTVTIAGGGGSGAAADAEVTWARGHSRRFRFSETCLANSLPQDFCMDQTSALFPVIPSGFQVLSATGCGIAEGLRWEVWASSSSDYRFFEATGFPLRYYFPGEAVWADVYRLWDVGGFSEGELAELEQQFSTVIVTHYTQRFFSRVAPSVVYRLSVPEQNPDDNVAITPTFRQYVDAKEDSVWILEGLQITNAGTNLRTNPSSATVELFPDGNAVERFSTTATFNFSPIQLALGPVEGFSVQPQLSFTTAPVGTTGFHSLTAASVTNGGQTDLPDGPVSLPVIVQQGHYDTAPNRVRSLDGTVTDGVLTGVTVPPSFQQLIRPATLATIAMPAQEVTTIGRSAFKTTRTHSQPTVTASAATVFPPQEDGAFAVALAQATDDNGEKYWYVDSVTVTQQGDGYFQGDPVIFEVQGAGIEAVPSVAYVITDRDEPTATASFNFATGSGAVLTPVFSQQQTPRGDKFWEVSSVTINNAGQGYTDGGSVTFFGDAGVSAGPLAFATYTVDGNGSIVGVNVIDKGRYFRSTNRAFRVAIVSGGKYYIRTTTPTSEPLPPRKCIGQLTEENGWDIRPRRLITVDASYEVGEQFFRILAGFDNEIAADSTRRCGIPAITLEWQ